MVGAVFARFNGDSAAPSGRDDDALCRDLSTVWDDVDGGSILTFGASISGGLGAYPTGLDGTSFLKLLDGIRAVADIGREAGWGTLPPKQAPEDGKGRVSDGRKGCGGDECMRRTGQIAKAVMRRRAKSQ